MDKEVHNFTEEISPKGNVIAQREFELAYYDVADQYVNHYATGTSPWIVLYNTDYPTLTNK